MKTHRLHLAFPVSFLLAASMELGCGSSSDETPANAGGQGGVTATGGQTGTSGSTESNGGTATGGSGGASGGAGGVEAFEYDPCSAASKVGEFRIDLAPDHPDAPQFTSVLGKVLDGVVPIQVPVVVREEGDCQLLTNPNLSCDPPCGVNQTCAESGCIAYPLAHDVGVVTIEGLAIPLEMMASASSKSYTNPAQPMLPHPGFDRGANLMLSAAGGDYEPFELSGRGIDPLEVSDEALVVSEGDPLAVEWSPPAGPGPARMRLNLNIDNHGVTSARIECDTEDDGAFEFSAALIDELIGQGFSGFPTLTLRRQTVDSTDITPGCVEFVVASELTLGIELEGLTSCSSDDDCSGGETCQPDLSCG